MAACLVLLSASAPVLAATEPPFGNWVTEDGDSVFALYPCANDRAAVCGRIAWLRDPVDERGKPVTDSNNASPALRDRPLMGLELLTGFRRNGERAWSGGTIYNPDDGRTYSASFTIKAPGVLTFTGCAFGVLCGSQEWRRPPDTLDRRLSAH